MSSKNNLIAYAQFQKHFFDDLQPQGIVEVQLTQTLADCSWRLNCARAYETNLLTLGTQEQAKTIKVQDAGIHYALATAKAYRDQVRAMASISMHEQRVPREFHRCLKELREIQSTRREEERIQKSRPCAFINSTRNCKRLLHTPPTNPRLLTIQHKMASFLLTMKSKPTSAVKTAG